MGDYLDFEALDLNQELLYLSSYLTLYVLQM